MVTNFVLSAFLAGQRAVCKVNLNKFKDHKMKAKTKIWYVQLQSGITQYLIGYKYDNKLLSTLKKYPIRLRLKSLIIKCDTNWFSLTNTC